ncbi:allene oxide cyclase barrel-like domain-containing protein [Nocardiopsis suaedae]|uniref:Allene oxide cyclase barrel-like domain-containing protein n=1 Tax=Nocardiopsis suaedae TaxID=3018444 RepID=A0ABT4TEL5_9ACTN|nr:hypothetical protein [Nocardiopsis suaedae]MDA2803148.1 hypothetical protein [Nocardiopsis suaedae]
MRKHVLPAIGVAAATAGALALGLSLAPTAANAAPPKHGYHHRTITIEAVETGTAVNLVDVAPDDSALGDQLIGTADLTDSDGNELGTSSFVGISTDAEPRTSEMLTFVYELPDGKITTAGTAQLSDSGPVFDEKFAITGGTGEYKNASGEVRVLQESMEEAKVTFEIRR